MEDTNNQHEQNLKRNRKRKKSFLQNARKYGKKGTFGRGSHLNEDTYNYFVRALEIYREGFTTDEEKKYFVNNVFEQTTNEEVNFSCNQVGCRVIETLLPFAKDEVVERFITAFSPDLRPLCSDRFASHVLQTLFAISCLKSTQNTDDTSEESKTKCKDFTLKLSKFLLNNLEDYINDTYGNHIIRTILSSLCGLAKENKNVKTEESVEKIPEEYLEIVKDYVERLISWPHFKDLPYNEISSGLLQILLEALYKLNLKLLKKVQKKLIDESYAVASEENGLPDVFDSKPATMLLESSLNVSTSKIYTKLYSDCFKGHLDVLAKRKQNNFSVQKLLNNCQDKTEFESIFEELSSHIEQILQCGHSGVIIALAQACRRLSTKQGPFVQQLMQALHCLEPQERQNNIAIAIAKLVPYERLVAIQNEHYFINLHGSLILQEILQFNKPIKIITSLLDNSTQELEKLFSDSKGSHIVDCYVKSQYVGEKSREKLSRKMQGSYQNLVTSKFGSRSFEALWNSANPKQKLIIMEELSHKDRSWTSSEFGRIIAGKINYELYRRNKEEWKQFSGKSNKIKNLLADIINE